MADRINIEKYGAMIAALNTFADHVSRIAEDMQTMAALCAQTLGDEDQAIALLYQKVSESSRKYEEATVKAKNIAALMEQDLEKQREDEAIWSSDGE